MTEVHSIMPRALQRFGCPDVSENWQWSVRLSTCIWGEHQDMETFLITKYHGTWGLPGGEISDVDERQRITAGIMGCVNNSVPKQYTGNPHEWIKPIVAQALKRVKHYTAFDDEEYFDGYSFINVPLYHPDKETKTVNVELAIMFPLSKKGHQRRSRVAAPTFGGIGTHAWVTASTISHDGREIVRWDPADGRPRMMAELMCMCWSVIRHTRYSPRPKNGQYVAVTRDGEYLSIEQPDQKPLLSTSLCYPVMDKDGYLLEIREV